MFGYPPFMRNAGCQMLRENIVKQNWCCREFFRIAQGFGHASRKYGRWLVKKVFESIGSKPAAGCGLWLRFVSLCVQR